VVDGWTIVAEIINFLILVVLLRLFLYKPIIRAMDTRQAEIESEFDEAERKRRDAEEQELKYRKKEEELESRRHQLMRQAEDQARKHREQLTEQAREDVDRLESRWKQELRREQQAFLQRLSRRAGEQVCSIARRALADLAEADLEARMVETFIRRFASLDAEEREKFVAAIKQAGGALTVTSAFELSDELRGRLTDAFRQHVLPDVEVQFDHSEDLICGVKAKAAGREVSWTAASYLQDLLERMNDTFAEEMSEEVAEESPREATAPEGPTQDGVEADTTGPASAGSQDEVEP